jgi:outer membrane protein assembly factor BamB
VVFGSDDGNLYAVVVTSGPPALWSVATGGQVIGAPMIAEVTAPGAGPGSTDTEMRVFFGSTDGRMRSRDVFQAIDTALVFPDVDVSPLGAIEAAPLVRDDVVFFGTNTGQVWAVDSGELQNPVWEAPFEAGSKVTVAPVGWDAFVFVGTEAGVLWKIDAATGLGEVCYESGGVPITSDPVIADGIIYIPVRDALSIGAVRASSCGPARSITLTAPVLSSPAISEDVLYTGNGRYLEAWDLETVSQDPLWRYPGPEVLGGLAGDVRWPVVVNGGVYFTSDDGWLHAVDKDGQELWKYNLEARSVTSPAPGTGVVFVADVGGTLHAIGCEGLPNCAQPDS